MSSSATAATKHTVASMRYVADMRQIAGLLLVTGIASVIAPLPKIASLIGKDGTTAPGGLPLSGLIGSLCLLIIGIVSAFSGYNALVHDWGNRWLTAFMLIFTQTAFIPYLTDMTGIGRAAAAGNGAFGLDKYDYTGGDVALVGAMGILGVLTYGFTYVGSISFFQFSMYAYQTGKPQERSAPYYRGRQTLYCAVLTVAGLSQLLLGAYINKNFGGGALPSPIAVAVYIVNFPGIAIFVGLMQILFGLWGMARSFGLLAFGERDHSFQGAMFLAWFAQLMLQIVTQISYTGRDAMAPMPAMITAMSIGLNLMPALLDYKARTLPEEIDESYYNADATDNNGSDDLVKDDAI